MIMNQILKAENEKKSKFQHNNQQLFFLIIFNIN
jgi:hypothetical protein